MAEFEVFVDDNFHYMDEDKAHVVGPFLGADEVLSAARKKVEDWFIGEL